MLPPKALGPAVQNAKLIGAHGPWTRVVAFHHLLGPPPGMFGRVQPLWGGASRINGARFTPRGSFDSVYLASDSATGLAEVQALAFLASGHFHPITPPWVVMSVDGQVSGVLDLTDAPTLTLLGTSTQEITGSWQLAPSPPTQLLAQTVYNNGAIVGIQYPSAKNIPAGVNLVVFPDRLRLTRTDFLEVVDPNGNLNQRLP